MRASISFRAVNSSVSPSPARSSSGRSLLLLDEPLSNLDAKLREETRSALRNLHGSTRVTTIYVTHDQGEAMAMSDRIAVLNSGNIHQVGAPEEIYERPATRFVADFIGRNNVIDATVAQSQRRMRRTSVRQRQRSSNPGPTASDGRDDRNRERASACAFAQNRFSCRAAGDIFRDGSRCGIHRSRTILHCVHGRGRHAKSKYRHRAAGRCLEKKSH